MVKECSSCATDGFLLRVLKGGGLASVAFIRPDQVEEPIRQAIGNAAFLGSRRAKPVRGGKEGRKNISEKIMPPSFSTSDWRGRAFSMSFFFYSQEYRALYILRASRGFFLPIRISGVKTLT